MVTKEEKETKPRYGTVSFERRKYPRFHIDLPIEYYRIDSSIGHTGKALDISEGGLLLHFPEQMDIGQYIKLKLFLSLGSELSAIEVLAEVVWMDIHLDKGLKDYRCGVNFIDVSPEDMAKLKRFLRNLSDNSPPANGFEPPTITLNQYAGFKSLHRHHSHLTNLTAYIPEPPSPDRH